MVGGRHESIMDAIELVKVLGPTEQALIVGFTCGVNVDEAAAHIASIQHTLPCPVALAHDGLVLNMDLS